MDYKKYSLENLENWMNDAISCGDATPQEIYDVIVGVVKETYYHHKDQVSRADELLGLLNSGGQSYEDVVKEREYYEQSNMTEQELSQYKVSLSCDKDDPSPECQGAWNDFWENNNEVEYDLREAEYYNSSVELPPNQSYIGWQTMSDDKFNQEFPPKKDKVVKWQLPVQVDGLTGDCYVEFPDDLLEVAGLKEGDTVEWIDRKDGSFELRKVNGPE